MDSKPAKSLLVVGKTQPPTQVGRRRMYWLNTKDNTLMLMTNSFTWVPSANRPADVMAIAVADGWDIEHYNPTPDHYGDY